MAFTPLNLNSDTMILLQIFVLLKKKVLFPRTASALSHSPHVGASLSAHCQQVAQLRALKTAVRQCKIHCSSFICFLRADICV